MAGVVDSVSCSLTGRSISFLGPNAALTSSKAAANCGIIWLQSVSTFLLSLDILFVIGSLALFSHIVVIHSLISLNFTFSRFSKSDHLRSFLRLLDLAAAVVKVNCTQSLSSINICLSIPIISFPENSVLSLTSPVTLWLS